MTTQNIKFRSPVPFPALVVGAGAIAVQKASGIWTISYDMTRLAILGSLADPATKQVAVFDPVTGVWNAMTLSAVASSALAANPITSINGGPIGGFRNLLINPYGRFNERAPASVANDVYGHDRWYALTQTAAIAVSTISDAENGTPRMWRLTQSQVAAQRMGYAQIIEGRNYRNLRGKSICLSGRVNCSLNQQISYAILEWTGTEDAPTSDVVNSWTNASLIAGQFFKSTTMNVLAVGNITPAAGVLTDLTPITAIVGNGSNNLIIFIWTNGTIAQNATLDGALQLEVGTVGSQREQRPHQIEQTLCQRFYQKSFSPGTAPAQNVGSNTGEWNWPTIIAGANPNYSSFIPYIVTMRTTPTVTLFNPAAANAQVRNIDTSTDSTGAAVTNSSLRGFYISSTGAAGWAANQRATAHWTADAEL